MSTEIDKIIQEQFSKLPKVIQNAVSGAEVDKLLRGLSDKHKLHLDQWQILEDEVLMALMGLQPVEKLEESIKNEVGLSGDAAQLLNADIMDAVFEPIRNELERELSHPEAKPEKTTPVEDMRAEILEGSRQSAVGSGGEDGESRDEENNVPTEGVAQTPPVKRGKISSVYAPGQSSVERRGSVEAVNADPYRESIDD